MDMRRAFDLTLKDMQIEASEIARRSGIAESDISKFRHGRINCGYQKVEKMIEALTPTAQDYFWLVCKSSGDFGGDRRLSVCEKGGSYKVSKSQEAIAV